MTRFGRGKNWLLDGYDVWRLPHKKLRFLHYPETQATRDADQTYLFAAGEHLTTRAHQFLADYVIKQVNASPLK